MSDVSDLLMHAVDKSPVDFANAFNDLVSQRARTAVEDYRVTLAQSIYNSDEDADLDNTDLDDLEDLDLDDLDLEDLDLDLDDLDLDNKENNDDEA